MFPSRPDRPLARLLRAVLAGCLLLAFGRGARAQFTRFENFTDAQGLGNQSVTALAQDRDGYVLFGTEAGLYRYDGSVVGPYGTTAGLAPGAWITGIAGDQQGRLWLTTRDALYLRQKGRFHQVAAGRPLHFESPHLVALLRSGVVIDDGGTLLRASFTPDGVGPFSPLLDASTLAAVPVLRHARFVVSDGDDALLVGCGVEVCRLQDGQVSVLSVRDGLPADRWQVAARGSDGTIWARSLDLLAWRRPGERSFTAVAVPGERGQFNVRVPARLALLADGRGGVLTQGEEGLLHYDGRIWRSLAHHEGGLSANPIECMMRDREGSLWVGTVGHGAFRSIGLGRWENWSTQDGLPSEIVWSMARLRDGQFWVATYTEAVELGREAAGLPGGSKNVVATRSGHLWLAPLRAPLIRLNGENGRTERFPIDGDVSTLVLDAHDRLWISTSKALAEIGDADAPANAITPRTMLPLPTLQVATDQAGTVWALTARGIYRGGPDSGFALAIPATALPGDPAGLAIAGDGELWVFTDSAGVLRFATRGRWPEALPPPPASSVGSNDILFLHRDRRGWMWVGTDHGIAVFDRRTWRRFDVSDGLINDDIDQNAVYEDQDGSMWFGTSRGLSHLLDPEHLPAPKSLHPLVTGLSIGGRRLPPSPSIRLDWSPAPLVIRFVDLDFDPGRNIIFRYRLHGLETGWNETTGRELRYASLPAGKFEFELVASDPLHGTESAPVRLTLHVRAPWWRRWWFYAACVTTGTASIAGTWQIRVRLLVRQRRRLERLVGERTSEIEAAKGELQRLALSDSLTGLANRRSILATLEEMVVASRSSGDPLAVLLCDLDHFKKINDGHGHLAGDAVLSAFGERLKNAIEPPEAAGRYGGEEFCIILPGSPEAVTDRVNTIRSWLCGAPYAFGGVERIVTTSGGLAFLRAGETALSLLARADGALYRAKGNGRNRIEHELEDPACSGLDIDPSVSRDASRQEASRARRDLERDLRAALAGGELALHYQPVVDVVRDVMTSCEALIRWHSPGRGLVPPSTFVPFAEEIGLMPELGDWVLRAACREAAGWPDRLRISVNLSAAQFRLPDLVARVESALAETGLAAARLELEVTETAIIDEITTAKSVLQALRELGVAVALDDFGTGYSSLSFLRTLPFDRIKIDRSFVQDLGTRPEATVIVRAMTRMCLDLGAAVTAEGVETDTQIEELRAAGCSEIQGYRIGRPCPAHDLTEWMAAFAASRVRRLKPVAPDPSADAGQAHAFAHDRR